MYLAASGDNGYNDNGAPDALASVVSVGGTTLAKSGNTIAKRSGRAPAPAARPASRSPPGSTIRAAPPAPITTSQPLLAAWPNTTAISNGGWFTVGGTSVASPFIGGVFGLAGNASNSTRGQTVLDRLGAPAQARFSTCITSGSNGSCGGTYLCTRHEPVRPYRARPDGHAQRNQSVLERIIPTTKAGAKASAFFIASSGIR